MYTPCTDHIFFLFSLTGFVYFDDLSDSDSESDSLMEAEPFESIEQFILDSFGPPRVDATPMASLHVRYPSLAHCHSFVDIVRYSEKYLRVNAVEIAGIHATEHYATHPRIDLTRIDQDAELATELGLLSFLSSRSAALAGVTLQPTDPLEPELSPDLPSMPPRPPDHTLHNFHQLCKGGPIQIPPGFTPNGCPEPTQRPPAYALAIEFIHHKDHTLGLSIILPLGVAQRLFRDAGLPLNGTPTSIVRKTDAREGRLVVDVTQAELNHLNKKDILSGMYGPIIYPTPADWCRLFYSVSALFPGEQLVMLKADIDRWYKRVLLEITQAGLLAMPFHIDGRPYVVIPLVHQFGCQEANYAASQASAFIYARMRARDIATHGGILRHVFSDDWVGFIPARLYESDDLAFTAIAEAHAGAGAAPAKKKDKGTTLVAVGAHYDITDMGNPTIGLSEATFVKLICLFFNEAPLVIIPGVSRLRFKFLQRLGSYMMHASRYITAMGPYTHAVYANYAGLPPHTRTVLINSRTALDIAHWRATLHATMYSVKWLRVPCFVPPLTCRPKSQSKEDFWAFQAANSHVIVGTDAARITIDSPTWGGGWTAKWFNRAYFTWGMYFPITFTEFFRLNGITPFDELQLSLLDQINFFEAIVVVLACDAILNNLPSDRPAHITIFVWCDNTSAIAWLTKYKNNHPAINYVLQVWSRLQAKHDATINSGHIRGAVNTDPDGISRNFLVPGGSAIRARLSHLTPHVLLPTWFHGLLQCSTQQSDKAWQLVASQLIQLEQTL